jgi:hypothetical protein
MRHKPAPRKPAATAQGPRPAFPATSSGRLRIEIGHIALQGYSPADRVAFRRTLESDFIALARLHKDRMQSLTSGTQISGINLGQLPPGVSAREAAKYIARQIFARLTPQSGGNRHA